MAAGVRELKIRFTGDAKNLAHASAEGQQAIGKWHAKVAAFGVAGGLAMAQLGRAVWDFARSSVEAFVEAEQSQTRLSDAYSRFPRLANVNIEQLRAFNLAMSEKTKFDKNAFASGESVLALFKLSGKQIKAVAPLLADYAARTGQDLPEAATTLGKAFLGNNRALKALGIAYKSTGNYAKDVTNITALVRKQVGGFAEKQGKTAAGQAAILSNRFKEIKETVGEKLLPVLMTLAKWGLLTLDWVQKNADTLLPLVGIIAAVTAAQWLWNAAMAASPIGLAVLTVGALILLVAGLAKKFGSFKDLKKSFDELKDHVLSGVRKAVDDVTTAIGDNKQAWRDLGDAITKFVKDSGPVIGFLSDLGGQSLGAALAWVAKLISAVSILNQGLQDVLDKIERIVGQGKVSHLNPKVHNVPSVAGFHGLARGGPARAGRDYLVGEYGPEVLRMGSRNGWVDPNGAGGGGDTYVSVWLDGQELRAVIRAEVSATNRSLKRGVLARAGAR